MSLLRIFETEEAKYYLGLGRHTTSSEPIFEDVDFSQLDLLVLEEDGISRTGLLKHIRNLQYNDLYERVRIENPNLKVYGVDINPFPNRTIHLGTGALLEGILVSIGALITGYSAVGIATKKVNRRDFLKYTGGTVAGMFLASTGLHMVNDITDDSIEQLTDLYNIRSSALPTTATGFRDAVTAKKISEYLVPQHKLENRKVNVAILYGGLHSGIETKIKNPWISDATIYLFHKKIGLISRQVLNEVREVVEIKGQPNMVYHNSGLF